MKSVLVFLVISCSACALFAGSKPLVVSSVSMLQDIAIHVGGSEFDYQTIVPIGSDPHLYDPTPSDATLCTRAQLVLVNGLTFEGWISKLIENSGTRAAVITVTDGITPIASTQYANATDPHAWMDVKNGIIYAQNIAAALSALAPAHAEAIHQRLTSYLAELEMLDQYILAKIQAIPEPNRILITSHDAFHYYGKRYGLRLESILGTSTDVDVQTADIRRLNEVIRTTGVPAVFIESTINPRMLQQIARDNGLNVGGKLYADSLSDKDGPASTYVAMLRYNTDTIYSGLISDRPERTSGSGTPIFLWLLIGIPIIALLSILLNKALRRA